MATISVVCQCGRRLRVEAEHAGRRAKCPGCGQQTLQVPIPLSPPGAEPITGADLNPRSRR